ncbi:E3 SUMO-protein ligase ZBED1-like [Watersipora subatra]|uniref:E3 SUMO-protein ligase ZBED1-like n=1 Tax=Watersipora subatra TaxID=2589382 RepID=UPI00355B19BC
MASFGKVKDIYKKYFIYPEDITDTFAATCKLCSIEVKATKRAKTSNLKAHLASNHKKEHEELAKDLSSLKEVKEPSNTATAIQLYIRIQPSSSFTKSQQKFDKSDQRQITATRLIQDVIVENLLPLSLLESDSFKALVNYWQPRYQIPSRKHFTQKILHQSADDIVQKVKDDFAGVKSVCLTMNIWTSRQNHGFIGITAHYIKDWQMIGVMLSGKRFKGRHTGERIAGVYSEIKVSYGIPNKVIAICTDNGLNVVKAISLPEFPSNEPADEEMCEDEMDEDHDTGGDDISDEDLDAMNCVLSVTQHHIHCFCHTVQLVVGDGLKKCSKTANHVLAKVNAIINHTRNSVISSELPGSYFNFDNLMLSCNLHCRADRKVAEEIRAILQPFKAATEQVEGDYHTGGQVIPIVKLLRHHLKGLQCEYPNHHLVNALQESVEKRLVQYEHDALFILCSSLDPRFKLVWCTETKSEYGETLLKSKIEDLVTLPSP